MPGMYLDFKKEDCSKIIEIYYINYINVIKLPLFILTSFDDSFEPFFFVQNINSTRRKGTDTNNCDKATDVMGKCGSNLEKHYCSNTYNNNNAACMTPVCFSSSLHLLLHILPSISLTCSFCASYIVTH